MATEQQTDPVESKESEEEVTVDFPAPEGWSKKVTLKKGGTPKKHGGIFINSALEEIKNKKVLEKYLRTHQGNPPLSEFDQGTGDVEKHNAKKITKETESPDVNFDSPAPEGCSRKDILKKGGTPVRHGDFFINSAHEEIKNKKALEKYLRTHQGNPPLSEFDRGSGVIRRHSAGIMTRGTGSPDVNFDSPALEGSSRKTGEFINERLICDVLEAWRVEDKNARTLLLVLNSALKQQFIGSRIEHQATQLKQRVTATDKKSSILPLWLSFMMLEVEAKGFGESASILEKKLRKISKRLRKADQGLLVEFCYYSEFERAMKALEETYQKIHQSLQLIQESVGELKMILPNSQPLSHSFMMLETVVKEFQKLASVLDSKLGKFPKKLKEPEEGLLAEFENDIKAWEETSPKLQQSLQLINGSVGDLEMILSNIEENAAKINESEPIFNEYELLTPVHMILSDGSRGSYILDRSVFTSIPDIMNHITRMVLMLSDEESGEKEAEVVIMTYLDSSGHQRPIEGADDSEFQPAALLAFPRNKSHVALVCFPHTVGASTNIFI